MIHTYPHVGVCDILARVDQKVTISLSFIPTLVYIARLTRVLIITTELPVWDNLPIRQ